MKLFDIYTWATGKKVTFLGQFDIEEQKELYNQATQFWNSLESNAYIFVILFAVIGILIAWYYYIPFNNKPWRHYHPKWWVFWLCACFVLTFFGTLGLAYGLATPNLSGAWPIEIKLSLVNGLYAIGLYFITSVCFCNYSKTNAYKIF